MKSHTSAHVVVEQVYVTVIVATLIASILGPAAVASLILRERAKDRSAARSNVSDLYSKLVRHFQLDARV